MILSTPLILLLPHKCRDKCGEQVSQAQSVNSLGRIQIRHLAVCFPPADLLRVFSAHLVQTYTLAPECKQAEIKYSSTIQKKHTVVGTVALANKNPCRRHLPSLKKKVNSGTKRLVPHPSLINIISFCLSHKCRSTVSHCSVFTPFFFFLQ